MTEFTYKARNEKGRPIKGKIEAENHDAVVDRLHKMGYIVVSVKEISQVSNILSMQVPGLSSIKVEEYVMMATQLSAMLSSGLSLTASLDILVDQTENPKLKTAISKVADDVRAGSSFADALGKQPDAFSNLFVSMALAGETAGNLEEVLKRLSTFLEKQAEFKQKVTTAMFYPVILLTFGIAVVVFITLTILPAFVKMYLDAGVALPTPTRILYGINQLLTHHWMLMAILFLGLYSLVYFGKRTPTGKEIVDRLVIDLPGWGPLQRKVEVARFCRTLSSLLRSGVPLLHALKTLEKATDNVIYAKVISNAYDNARKGGTVSEVMSDSGEFPPMACKMAAVGEETGPVDNMLAKVADFYEMSVDYAIKRFTALLEPLFLIILGGLVGFILAAVILPIFQMVTTLKR